ncbi:Transcriptional regulator GlxA family, contains an amidase domain and an AraC-type DNA-binding HTH domain [Mucilaginibacter gossypiicola]|uniref:Transcriptional regulator GlxA family, contains an amidase domain and an AraC-type DNA-binding HTH domain n=1 Tax=Mucilaginibacter gossypiicola TaxID=551995 RepID=A0A1H8BQ21_9SPHI|nr:helix-turn-helix domain-containing protein [Mucilaginibacter gossypiicola]SEM84007.1 Transcriptional regulator GlxA family, contains an amidase domain and an AraC-type DNA-binding HTH domain [Mucilaginibacter gossypiicola]
MEEANGHPDKKSIIIVAMTANMLLNFSGPADVFINADRYLESCDILDGYDVKVVAPTSDKKLDTAARMSINCELCVADIQNPIDTLIIAGNDSREASQPGLTEFYVWLATRNEHNTRRIASICGGAFVLAKAGILNGRKATTHWQSSERLSKTYPNIEVNANPFFTRDGHVYTSAGVSSGIDLALALVEQDYNKDIAVSVARKLVFYLSRPGFQSQFGSLLPVYEREHIGQRTQNWIAGHLNEKMDVNQIAEQMNMSTRNFTRVFHRETGMPPAKFVEKLRVEAARKCLEDSDMPLERIAESCGLGGLVSMRRIFLRHLNTTPSDYRRAFRTSLRDFGIESLIAP